MGLSYPLLATSIVFSKLYTDTFNNNDNISFMLKMHALFLN